MVIFKGINLSEHGIVVEKIPTIPKPKKRITQYEIKGRDGLLTIDEETYESFSLSIDCHWDSNLGISSVNEICELLDGYGTLSFDGQRQYTAIVKNQIPFEQVLNNFKKFTIEFLVNPIAEDINYTTVDLTNSLSISESYSKIYPIITITTTAANTSYTINGTTFQLLTSGTFILDCKNKVITKNNINASK